MTIHLPKELESSIEAVVQGGHFATVDDAMAEAARLLLRDLKHRPQPPAAELIPDPIIGSMRDAADELDEIVADAYRQRREDKGRAFDFE
jgi:Arc/MetJ-type ribon-helix-helix transcriptional regulator